jgi:hypothetical protein
MHELGDFPRVRNQVTAADLKNAIEARHSGVATLLQSLPVREHFFGRKVWEAVVFVFAIEGCAGATRVYAWAEFAGRQTERRVVAVLHQGAITSPKDAVRATVAAESWDGSSPLRRSR